MPTYAITGANRGLGLEFVNQLSQNSSNTILATTRSLSSDLSSLQAIAGENKNFHILECDTGNESSIKSFSTEAAKVLQGSKIDFLLNNAGVNSVPEQTSLDIGSADLMHEISINVVGPAKVVENLVSSGLLADNVRVLNMSSGLGSMVVSSQIEPRKCATYSISKAALNMLTVHQAGDLRNSFSPEAVVICMDPGWVKTRMGGEGAVLEPEESIGGMLKVLHRVGKSDSGKYFTYDGSEVAW